MSIVTNAAETTEANKPQDGQPSAPKLVLLDPHQVEPEDNIRWNVDLDKDFVASVRQHGVLLPVRARTDADGKILIRDGRRRLMAARETGQQLPVFLVDATDEKAERIIEQHATNKHRRGLSTAEEVDVWQQLSLEGMSPATIARKTGTKRAVVDAGLAVAEHENASKAVADYDLTLDQAAVLIQLEDDPGAVEELREVAESDPAQFDHLAQELLDAKATREEVAKLRADYEANGVIVVDWPSGSDPDVAFLYHLRAADGSHLTEENYAGQPGYAIALDEGHRGAEVAPVVVNWKEHGLRHVFDRDSARGGPMTSQEKAERRVVIANNKAWASAEKVRRGWVRKLLSRMKLPTDASAFAVGVLVEERFAVERAVSKGHRTAGILIGVDAEAARDHLARTVAESRSKTGHVLLAVALGALEDSIDRTTWRNPTTTASRYLGQLAAWGYTLSAVEQLVIDEGEPARPDDGPVDARVEDGADAADEPASQADEF